MAPKATPKAKAKARATYFSEPSKKPMSEATSNLTSIEADSVKVFDAVLKKYVDIRSVELLDPEYVACTACDHIGHQRPGSAQEHWERHSKLPRQRRRELLWDEVRAQRGIAGLLCGRQPI